MANEKIYSDPVIINIRIERAAKDHIEKTFGNMTKYINALIKADLDTSRQFKGSKVITEEV